MTVAGAYSYQDETGYTKLPFTNDEASCRTIEEIDGTFGALAKCVDL